MSRPNPFENLNDEEIEKAFQPLNDSGVRERVGADELLDPADVDRVVERVGKKLSAAQLRKDREKAITAEDRPAGITVGKDAVAGSRPLTIREYAIGFVKMHHRKKDLKEALHQKLDAVVTAFQFSEDERQKFVEAVEKIQALQEERESALQFLRGELERVKAGRDLSREVIILRLIDDFQSATDSPSVTADTIFSDMAVDPDHESVVNSLYVAWLKSNNKKDDSAGRRESADIAA